MSKGKKAAPSLDDQAEGILLANRWLKAAAAIVGTDAGCVIITDNGMARVAARYNVPHAFLVSNATIDTAPYARDETVLLRDATQRPEIHALLGTLAMARTGFFYRRLLTAAEGRVIALLLFGETPLPNIGDRELSILDEIADSMALEMERYYPPALSGLSASMRMTMADILSWIERTDPPAAMFDSGLVLRAVNGNMRSVVPYDWDQAIGKHIMDLEFPARGSVEFLFRHALDTQLSTPRIDMALEDSAGRGLPQMLRVLGSPLQLLDSDTVLIATLDPRKIAPAPLPAVGVDARQELGATTQFLLETLVQRRSLRSRANISFVTLRSWRKSIREHQISALKAIKRNTPESIASEIAAEMRDDVKSLFGAGSFKAVVPMPCGHSPDGRCLSVAIAQALGRDLGLPVAHVLTLPPEKGSSHPKRNASRPAMSLGMPVEGPVLLVDDVATSGRHIEEATALLRSNGTSVLAMAWIGGDSD